MLLFLVMDPFLVIVTDAVSIRAPTLCHFMPSHFIGLPCGVNMEAKLSKPTPQFPPINYQLTCVQLSEKPGIWSSHCYPLNVHACCDLSESVSCPCRSPHVPTRKRIWSRTSYLGCTESACSENGEPNQRLSEMLTG